MTNLEGRSDCEVTVVGAGPYGLSVAAHLKGAGVETQVFGDAMSFWRDNMPKGMNLRSPLQASDLSDPAGAWSLQAYAKSAGIRLQYPLPLDELVRYGEWFRRHAVGDLVTRRVARIEAGKRGFCLTLADGERIQAGRVVLAMGLANQEYRPDAFAGMPSALVSHTCEHDDLSKFRGKHVAVIGRGQSACESAALLTEAEADTEIICRGPINWLGALTADPEIEDDPVWALHRWLSAPSGVGPFPLNWLNELPGIVHALPRKAKLWINGRSLRPGVAGWVRPRFDDVRVNASRKILRAREQGGRIMVETDTWLRGFDHVLLATGYRIDISKLGILTPGLIARIWPENTAPVLSAGMESSVKGLHFVGASAVASFGPLMRFIAG